MMDVCTNLVQSYLRVNGYFTATDYPLVESSRSGSTRTLTDIDMLAVRFARPSSEERHKRAAKSVEGPMVSHPDPVLGCPEHHTDMIVAEIKQGRAQVNPAARNRYALAAALTRFGCCDPKEAPGLVQNLLRHGRAKAENDHVLRMVVFASHGEQAPRGWHWVHLDRVFRFLDNYLLRERSDLSSVDLHDPALAWLSLLHKCELGLSDGRVQE